MTYRSDSGTLDFQANLDPRNNWRKRAVDEPPPPLDLTYRAENGEATIVGASGTVDASDRAGVIYIRPDGGVATAVTSTGTVRASGTGVLRLRGEERGSRVLLSPPCDLDLTVDPGEGVAQFGLTFDTGDRLDVGTYHAKATRPPLDSMVPPSLTVTRVSPSLRDASRTASAVLTGASEQVRTPPSDKQRPPAGDVAGAKPSQLRRGQGNAI